MEQRELVNKEISNLFEAIFSRITKNDMENIIKMNTVSMYASLNMNNRSQLLAQREVTNAINESIKNIIDHDMNTILKVLTKSELMIRLSKKVLDENN